MRYPETSENLVKLQKHTLTAECCAWRVEEVSSSWNAEVTVKSIFGSSLSSSIRECVWPRRRVSKAGLLNSICGSCVSLLIGRGARRKHPRSDLHRSTTLGTKTPLCTKYQNVSAHSMEYQTCLRLYIGIRSVKTCSLHLIATVSTSVLYRP